MTFTDLSETAMSIDDLGSDVILRHYKTPQGKHNVILRHYKTLANLRVNTTSPREH